MVHRRSTLSEGVTVASAPAAQVSEAFDDGGGFFMDAEVYTPPEVAVVPAPAAAPASSDSKKPRGLKDLERERQAKAREPFVCVVVVMHVRCAARR